MKRILIKDVAAFLKSSADTLYGFNYTCCRMILDDNFAIYVGWSAGYGEEKRDDVMQDPKNPDYAINAGVKIRNDADWCDYDFINFAISSDDSGDVWDSGITLEPHENYKLAAKWLIEQYRELKKAYKAGKIKLI